MSHYWIYVCEQGSTLAGKPDSAFHVFWDESDVGYVHLEDASRWRAEGPSRSDGRANLGLHTDPAKAIDAIRLADAPTQQAM